VPNDEGSGGKMLDEETMELDALSGTSSEVTGVESVDDFFIVDDKWVVGGMIWWVIFYRRRKFVMTKWWTYEPYFENKWRCDISKSKMNIGVIIRRSCKDWGCYLLLFIKVENINAKRSWNERRCCHVNVVV
jgi:hypothetical protein